MVPGARLPTQFPTPRCNRSIAELSWQSPVAAGSEWSLKIETAGPLSLRGTICHFSREMQTVFLKKGRDHPEAPRKVGERKRTNQTDPPRTKGGTGVPRRNATSRDRSSNQGRLLERKASHLANMPPPPEHPSQVSGASCMDPCYDALVGATTPTDNTSACANQPLGHWRPLTAIVPRASKARLTSGREGPATGNSEPTRGACQGCPRDNCHNETART